MPVEIITINNQAYMLFKILPFKIISNKYHTNLKKGRNNDITTNLSLIIKIWSSEMISANFREFKGQH